MSIAKKTVRLFCTLILVIYGKAAFSDLPVCTDAPAGTPCHFTNVSDFSGGSFEHVSFDSVDERTVSGIEQKFSNILSFDIEGGNGTILHTSNHLVDFPAENTAGGAVSGEYRIDLGYFGSTEVTVIFNMPVKSAGGFFGGNLGHATLKVFLADNTVHSVSLSESGIPGIPGSDSGMNPECASINGFLGIDTDGGAKITRVVFTVTSDASSLDSLFFGTAEGGSNGPGVFSFPETSSGTDCSSLGYVAPPVLPESLPVTDDGDSDGLPDSWEELYGLNPFDASDAELDSDGDGLSNLTEFVNGSDPTSYDSGKPGIQNGELVLDGILHLLPQGMPPVDCSVNSEGAMYYDSQLSELLVCDGAGWTHIEGQQGETGPGGEPGLQGEKGDTGERGETGADGSAGEKGDTGEAGPQGIKGDTGSPGKDAPFANIQCLTNQIIRFNGTTWECATDIFRALSLDCKDGDTIIMKSGVWQCVHLKGKKIKKGDHRNKSRHSHSEGKSKHKQKKRNTKNTHWNN